MIDEKKIAGASYILNFFKDVYYLTHYGTIYINILIELDHEYPDEEARKKIPEEQRQVMLNNMQMARYHGKTAFYQYLTIIKKYGNIKEADHGALLDCVEELNTKFILRRETVDVFIQEMNNVLINDMIQNVLETNQELINIMLSGGQGAKEKTDPSTG